MTALLCILGVNFAFWIVRASLEMREPSGQKTNY